MTLTSSGSATQKYEHSSTFREIIFITTIGFGKAKMTKHMTKHMPLICLHRCTDIYTGMNVRTHTHDLGELLKGQILCVWIIIILLLCTDTAFFSTSMGRSQVTVNITGYEWLRVHRKTAHAAHRCHTVVAAGWQLLQMLQPATTFVCGWAT